MTGSNWIAIVAVVIAGGALALGIRRWFESGVRLSVSLMPDAQMVGGMDDDDAEYLGVFVVNRGNATTTITTLGLETFASPWRRFRLKKDFAAIVTNPEPAGTAPNLPQQIGPNARWTGLVTYDEQLLSLRESGKLWVSVYGSHSDKPTSRRVPPKQSALEGTKIPTN